eukprot:4519806-Amphidinium_carterae.2
MLAEGQVPLAYAQADQPPCIAEEGLHPNSPLKPSQSVEVAEFPLLHVSKLSVRFTRLRSCERSQVFGSDLEGLGQEEKGNEHSSSSH